VAGRVALTMWVKPDWRWRGRAGDQGDTGRVELGWVQTTNAGVEEKYWNASLAQEIDESVGQWQGVSRCKAVTKLETII